MQPASRPSPSEGISDPTERRAPVVPPARTPLDDAPPGTSPSTATGPSPAPTAPAGPAAGVTVPATGAAPGGLRPGPLLVLILGTLTALAPLSMDMYLPALPEVTSSLGTTSTQVQLTITTFLIGLALGQLLAGPLSDAVGRRRPLLVGISLYLVATAACAVAPNIETLTALRMLQGLTGAAGVVIARAVVRDYYSGVAAARLFSSLMLISGLAPILAPVVGGQLMRVTSWQGIFVAQAVLGVFITLLAAWKLRETLPVQRRRPMDLGDTLRTMGRLLADRTLLGYLLAFAFGFSSIFAYISASSVVLQEVYGASPQTYSLLFGLVALGMVGFTQVNGRVLVGRFSPNRLIVVGLGVILGGGALLVVLTAATEASLWVIVPVLWVTISATGLVMPNCTTEVLNRAPHAAGSASALLGTSQFLVGSLVAPLAAMGGGETALPMALTLTGMAVVALGALLALSRPWRRG
ncbi:Bcr/CflA family multidrug efflux MFS transporter [Allostreptomyces psammosilenae]|uniref:DHA1 family bicyclomycin/chloramphenicol resistance-like MFS transporter n=1 Tax=Allostreptomyces psammosilenae TaxID=1892865 RepID=A0A852ZXW6_9ACTN|nr:Bcr/CflA family multidrug efflux MFS transporter [Allostreptomyces psammosilenae]NYI06885.1 DHA1 family bicyclomycin/chloramphenicol resistance-like MFS transporter [Allostreptomyces psammosilenae]